MIISLLIFLYTFLQQKYYAYFLVILRGQNTVTGWKIKVFLPIFLTQYTADFSEICTAFDWHKSKI